MLPSVWNPLREFARLDREFGGLFGHPTGEDASESVQTWYPAVEIRELAGDGYKIVASVPGISKEDIHVEVENNVLTLSGERKEESEKKEGERVIRRETFYGRFSRSFRLPDAVDGSKIVATYKDGQLAITVPKAESAKPRRIEIAVK